MLRVIDQSKSPFQSVFLNIFRVYSIIILVHIIMELKTSNALLRMDSLIEKCQGYYNLVRASKFCRILALWASAFFLLMCNPVNAIEVLRQVLWCRPIAEYRL